MPVKICQVCAAEFKTAEKTQRFCSYKCTGVWRSQVQRGESHPSWRGGKDKRTCKGCGASFEATPASPRKFCSRPCADKHGFRKTGADNPNYKPDARRRNRRGKHGAWARAVISRDKATCQSCGTTGVPLHAHHIKEFANFPDLRWELSNGVTLCAPCHWQVHAASNANGVKSGEVRPGGAEDNPEPSFGRKPVEGVTTNGRAYRRWNGECGHCGTFISKRWSDTIGKQNLFCSRSCASKWRVSQGLAFVSVHGGNSDTSALPERDDIV